MDIFLGSTILGKLFILERRNQGGYEKEGWHEKSLKKKIKNEGQNIIAHI